MLISIFLNLPLVVTLVRIKKYWFIIDFGVEVWYQYSIKSFLDFYWVIGFSCFVYDNQRFLKWGYKNISLNKYICKELMDYSILQCFQISVLSNVYVISYQTLYSIQCCRPFSFCCIWKCCLIFVWNMFSSALEKSQKLQWTKT